MIARPLIDDRLDEIEAAFEQEDAYDALVMLQRLTVHKREALGLAFHELSYSERLVSYALWFHHEVANGLLEQFFISRRGVHALALLEALRRIGALKNHNTFACALSAFPLSRPARDQRLRRQQMACAGRDKRLLLAALDRAFAYEAEDVPTLTVTYLARHKADFV